MLIQKNIQNQLFYRISNNSKFPLLLLHGFGEDSNIWKYQENYFGEKYRLILPDIKGSGRSIMDHTEWTMEHGAAEIKLILDNERISQCIMIGHSMGGYITLAFAEKYPQYLAGWGLFHSTAFADNDEKKRNRQKSIEFIQTHGAYTFLKQTIPHLFTEKYQKEHASEVEELLEAGKAFSAEALITYYKAMMARPDRTVVLKQSVKPVLMIIGEEDKAVPLADSLQQASFAEQSLIKILPQVAHMGMWEAPATCNKTIEEFIELVNTIQ
jgi:pimeloyl-ACP methyl ester carboxylesterase